MRTPRTPRPVATERDREYFRQVLRDGDRLHPFTTGKFEALGWIRQETFGGAFLGGSNAYRVTRAGMAVLGRGWKA